jgi:integrase
LSGKAERAVPWVFFHGDGSPIRNFRDAWLNACSRAGLVCRIPHDFRRTAVRNLERAGVPAIRRDEDDRSSYGRCLPALRDR